MALSTILNNASEDNLHQPEQWEEQASQYSPQSVVSSLASSMTTEMPRSHHHGVQPLPSLESLSLYPGSPRARERARTRRRPREPRLRYSQEELVFCWVSDDFTLLYLDQLLTM